MLMLTAASKLHVSPATPEGLRSSYKVPTSDDVLSASLSRDNRHVAFVRNDGLIELAKVTTKSCKPVQIITAARDVFRVCFASTNPDIIAIASRTASLGLYHIRSRTLFRLYNVPSPIIALDFNVTDKYLVVACKAGHIVVYDMQLKQQTLIFEMKDRVTALHFHPFKLDTFGVATKHGDFHMLTVDSSVPLWSIDVGKCAITEFALSPLKERPEMVTLDEGCRCCIFDREDGTRRYRSCFGMPPTSVDYSSDGSFFAVGMIDGSVYLFKTEQHYIPHQIINVHYSPIHFLKFNYGDNDISWVDQAIRDVPIWDPQFNAHDEETPFDIEAEFEPANASAMEGICQQKKMPEPTVAEVEEEAFDYEDKQILNRVRDELLREFDNHLDDLTDHFERATDDTASYMHDLFDKSNIQAAVKWAEMRSVVQQTLDDLRLRDNDYNQDNPIEEGAEGEL